MSETTEKQTDSALNQGNEEDQQPHQRLQAFSRLMESGTLVQVRRMLNGLYPGEIAHLLESLPPEKREFVWELVDSELQGDVLLEVNDDIRERLIRQMETTELLALTEGFETDDLADFIQDLPDTVTQLVLQSMDSLDRRRLEAVLFYPEDTAGGLMNTDTITVRPDVSLDVVLRYLRRRGEIPRMTDNLFVVDRQNHYIGQVHLADLLTREPSLQVGELVHGELKGVSANMPATEVASLFQQRDLISAPVIDDNGELLGRITIDDVVDVIRDEAEHSIMSMAGLSEEDDMFAPVVTSTRRRALWLGINLITALIASLVIAQFDATIEKLVALAVLMPVVASMGGIAGSQTLTLVIRGMALGQIGVSNARRLVVKELAVGMLNGILWALVIAGVATFWFDDIQLGIVIGVAIVINLITAALAGVTIPLFLKKIGADPALGGGVVLTTITDVIGFMAFLGLAAIFLV
ncbi:magnesium transporter [Sulfuriflexus sp.]|uniref:magnesium transporter n=1 Tax=Sulfuriflexus sp. TaxID=2015443 RepID=UPI0028CCAC33|nr:magnesium transporter [Sulfuriflexus sp.]MDT8403478.1 magnesium transporter [Sulfuriflexus sp.]